MTTRQHLNRVRRRSYLIGLPGIALFLGGVANDFKSDAYFALGMLGMVLCTLGSFYLYFGSRCLHCGKRTTQLFHSGGTPWSVSRDFKFCPHCRYSLDEDVQQNPAV